MAEFNETHFGSRGQMIDYFQEISQYDFDKTVEFLQDCEWNFYVSLFTMLFVYFI